MDKQLRINYCYNKSFKFSVLGIRRKNRLKNEYLRLFLFIEWQNNGIGGGRQSGFHCLVNCFSDHWIGRRIIAIKLGTAAGRLEIPEWEKNFPAGCSNFFAAGIGLPDCKIFYSFLPRLQFHFTFTKIVNRNYPANARLSSA